MSFPNLHIFNPSCETAIANGTVSYVPNKTLLTFEQDLAYLPSVFAKNEDLILMHEYEDLSHIELLHSLNFPVPGQILQRDFFEADQKIISDIEQYKLWGFAPNWVHRLRNNKTVDSIGFENLSFYNWNEEHKKLYSRKTAKKVLESIITTHKDTLYIDEVSIPQVFTSLTEIEAFLTKHQKIVLKEPWSSSGRGILMLRKSNLNVSISQRINGVFKQQEYIMAEPMLDKKMDFALHFEVKKNELNFIGDTYFFTNSNGQYQGNYLNQLPKVEPEILEFLELNKKQLQFDLQNALQESKIPQLYEGFFGVDIMIVKQNGKLVFQPCVEINLRNNMGTVALHLQKIIHPEAKGSFNIIFNPKKKFEDIYREEIQGVETMDGRFKKGIIPLVSPKNKQFGAFVKL